MPLRLLFLVLCLLARPVLAAPRVVADIAPVHGLVAQVMDGIAVPDLLIPPGVSPHDHRLRPSEAAALEHADLVIWVGPALTPGFERALKTLAPGAGQLRLLDAEGTRRHAVRDGATFAPDTDHAEQDVPDPHAWLDPDNARTWLDLIAEMLAARDPANAETYRANAAEGRALIDGALAGIDVPPAPRAMLAYHDAYQYLEPAFGLTIAGAITGSDATAPSPARLNALRDMVRDRDIACILAEPPVNPGLVDAVFEGRDVAIALLDPMGSALGPGPGFYPALLRDLSAALATCP